MGKSEKTKINVKDRIDDITIDLSLSDVSEIPVNEIVSVSCVVRIVCPPDIICVRHDEKCSLCSVAGKV